MPPSEPEEQSPVPPSTPYAPPVEHNEILANTVPGPIAVDNFSDVNRYQLFHGIWI